MEEQIKQLENRVNQLEAALMQVNEAGVRTDLRLTAYVQFLIKRNAFTIQELESVKGLVDAEIERMKQPVEQPQPEQPEEEPQEEEKAE